MTDIVEIFEEPILLVEAIERGPQGVSPDRSLYGARVVSPVAGVVSIDCKLGTSFLVNLSENVTEIDLFNVPDAAHSQGVELYFRQLSAGGKTVAGWPPAYWPASFVPPLSLAPNAIDIVLVKSSFGILFATLVATNYGLVL